MIIKVKVKTTDNIIGLKEDIVSRIEDIADVERVDVEEEYPYFSPEDVRHMTSKDVKNNYSAIMKSMKEWN